MFPARATFERPAKIAKGAKIAKSPDRSSNTASHRRAR